MLKSDPSRHSDLSFSKNLGQLVFDSKPTLKCLRRQTFTVPSMKIVEDNQRSEITSPNGSASSVSLLLFSLRTRVFCLGALSVLVHVETEKFERKVASASFLVANQLRVELHSVCIFLPL